MQMIKRHKMPCPILQPNLEQSKREAAQRVVGKGRKGVQRINQRLIQAQRAKLLVEHQNRSQSQRLRQASQRLSVCFTRIAIEVTAVRSCMKEHQRPRRSQRLRQQRPLPRLPWPRCSLAVFEEPRHQGPTWHQWAKPGRCSCTLSRHFSHQLHQCRHSSWQNP